VLDQVDLKKKLDRKTYKETAPALRLRLAELQREVKEAGMPVVVVFEGWETSGKGTVLNQLLQPLDPRGFRVENVGRPGEDERFRPFFWAFWRRTPANGRIAFFNRSWYRRVLDDRLTEALSPHRLDEAFQESLEFERQLAQEGALLVKFFLHISKKEQRKRLKALEAEEATSWRVTKEDWERHERYDEMAGYVEEMLLRTDRGEAPWTLVESHDREYAEVKILATLVKALEERLAALKADASGKKHLPDPVALSQEAPASVAEGDEADLSGGDVLRKEMDDVLRPTVLGRVDLSRDVSVEEYKKQLPRLQDRFREIQYALYRERIPVVVLFEGWDAAGKGGCIKRLTSRLDPRGYEVDPVAAPNDIERAHHYLWRFWTAFPKAGHVAIFDRSWYGRVLVERVEGFCSEDAWRRAYGEINEMENQWSRFGTVVIKFWLHIDREEQLRRFTERSETPEKMWKITEEDWRNREKWPLYEKAVEEMLWRTSTPCAPWTVVEANSKEYARIKVLKTVVAATEAALEGRRIPGGA
jgi:polyphosphate kinase 2 (PPK2 family)